MKVSTAADVFAFRGMARCAGLLDDLYGSYAAAGGTPTYVEETNEEAWESRRPSGAPDWMIEGWISTYVAIAEGALDRLSGDVEAVTGRVPMSLEQTLDAHPELLSGELPG